LSKRTFAFVSILGLVGVFTVDAVRKNWCDNPISSKEEAIGLAKAEGVRRDFFNFPELGGSLGFVARLTEADCCDAVSAWEWSRMARVWSASLDIEQKDVLYVRGIPRYHASVDITRCRFVVRRGKVKWE
jgi:hypothetical protein